MNHAFLLFCLTLFVCCNRQNNNHAANTSGKGPTVIRVFNAVGLAPDFDTTLVSQYIRSIFQDSKGNLWFGTLGEGVVRYDKKTLRYFSDPDGFYNKTVYAINEDKNGNMWFGTDQGIYKYNGLTFRNYNQKDGLIHTDITRKGILVDRSGTIWVGTHGGVYQYNSVADAAGTPCFSLFSWLASANVADLMEDKHGNIWIATTGQGVYRFDGSTLVNFNEKEGLGENYASGIAEDNAGHIWFTMKNGICKYDGKTFTEYTNKDGLGGKEFWGICIEDSGIIWITARGSTTRFDPSLNKGDPGAFRVFTPEDGLNCCVQSMYQDKSGNMWWGAGSGLYRFDGTRFFQVKQSGPWPE
ncbi:MAG: regulator [Saprospiraceae bacterium]|nr:regulator [Saprospiraceae bacterium]